MINWKLRLKNKTTLITLATTIIAAVYSILATFGVTPSITQEQTLNLIIAAISLLVSVGVVTDPTTAGMSDSKQALTYEEPKVDGAHV